MLAKSEFFGFLKFIFHSPESIIGFCLLTIFFLNYPGENVYLVENPVPQKKIVREFPLEQPKLNPYPVLVNEVYPTDLSAESVAVMDVDSAVLMYSKNPKTRLLPASTTKIMTAIVVLENYPLDKVITVSDVAEDGSNMGLVKGERITVKNLLYGLLIKSGNDAAEVLAENFPGGYDGFVDAMNKKAEKLYMGDTHFTNPVGFDQEGHYSTATDLARLASYALQNKTFAETVDIQSGVVKSVDGRIAHRLDNVNKLLGKVEGVNGIKTGWTQEAGECLVGSAERSGRRVITVVLKSSDRFAETKELIEWAFKNHQWQNPRENI